MIDDEPDLSIYDFNSIINYIKDHFIQILLLIVVFCIIYTVDYISNINTILMAQASMMPGIPGIPQQPIKMFKKRKMFKK